MPATIKTTRKDRCRNQGAILSMVIITLLLLSIASMSMLSLAQASQVRAGNNTCDILAKCAADAGIEKMIYLMNQQLKSGTFNSNQLPALTNEPMINANASYTVNYSGNLSTGYQLTSAGSSGSRSRTVRVNVILKSAFADFAIFGKDKVDFKNKAIITGYNSSNPFDLQTTPAIGTESTKDNSLLCKNKTEINADVYLFPGADSKKVISGAEAIQGEIFTLPAAIEFPDIKTPKYESNKGNLSGNTVTLNSTDSGNYSTISIKDKLIVNGNCSIVISGNISLDNKAAIEVSENSSLTIYLSGNFDGKNASGVTNKTNNPANFKLYGVGSNQDITLKNSSAFYGAIYAPNADVRFDNGAAIYGAVIGEDVEVKNSGAIYCDKALRKAKVTDADAYFAATNWEYL